MTIVKIELTPPEISVHGVAAKADMTGETDDNTKRFLIFEGKPTYGGTYKDLSIELFHQGKRVPLPNHACFSVHDSPRIVSAEIEVNYILEFCNPELGLAEPTQIAITVDLSRDLFESLWQLTTAGTARITVGIAFLASKTDFTGHMVTWNTNDTDQPLQAQQFWFRTSVRNGITALHTT